MTIHKEKILPITAAINSDNSINEELLISEIKHVFAQAKANHYKISLGEMQLAPGKIFIGVLREEIDPSVHAK